MKDMLRQFLGDAVDSPEVDEMLSALGLNGAGAPGAGAGAGAVGGNPMAAMMANNPAAFGAMQAQLQQMFAGGDEAVNATLATDVARRAAAQGGDSSVGEASQRDVEQVSNVASLWLDAVTEFPALDGPARVVSRAEWVESTMPSWVEALTPLADGVNDAVSASLTDRLGDDPEALQQQLPPGMGLPPGMDMSTIMGQMAPLMRKMSSSMFSMQLGQAAGALSHEVVSGTDVGLPLVGGEQVLMLPANVRDFAEGLEIDPAEVMLFLTVRESARQRLYAGAPWVRSQVLEAVRAYAADMRLDTEGIESKVAQVDPTDPEAMQKVLADGLFHPEPSESQKAALTRLETWLALVEGWVDVVTDAPPAGRCPTPTRWLRWSAAAAPRRARRRRPSPGWWGWSCAPAGCGTPPTCLPPWRTGTAPPPGTRSGTTRTWPPMRPPWTMSWASCRPGAPLPPGRSPAPTSTPSWPSCSMPRAAARAVRAGPPVPPVTAPRRTTGTTPPRTARPRADPLTPTHGWVHPCGWAHPWETPDRKTIASAYRG